MIKTYKGQPSYSVNNDLVDIKVTVRGGHLTASFNIGKKEINPYFIAPWYLESHEGLEDIISVLRGDFFCFPFGGNSEPYQGLKHPGHGKTANECWEFHELTEDQQDKKLVLKMRLDPFPGKVEKHIKIANDETIIYQNHIIQDHQGQVPVGYHPSLQLPNQVNAAFIDISEPLTGFTTPIPMEDPKNKGYSQLRTNVEITDRTKVPCINGTNLDLSKYPPPRGFEDLVIFICDPEKNFVFSAISVPNDEYLYFQLKNPKTLSQTLYWMSNGGRHFPPWNGRVSGVFGLEEVTGFFHYGIKPSVEDNFLQEHGFKTYLDLDQHEKSEIKMISGVIPIKKDFKGVQDIIQIDDSKILIKGKGGEEIETPCQVDFLK
jgi:hypothetical protein